MKKYIVVCKTVWHEEYLVEAENKDDAKNNFNAMESEELSNDYQYFDDIVDVYEAGDDY